METLTVLIDDKNNSDFIIELLSKFPFIIDINSQERKINFSKQNADSPFRKRKGVVSIDDLAGIWKETPKDINVLREKAWKRN